MGLRDLAETIPSSGETRPSCSIARLRDAITDDDRAWLDDALAGPKTGTWIAKVLQAGGHDIAAHNLQRHRRRECKCP